MSYIAKLGIVLLICLLSAGTAIHFTDKYVMTVNAKQKSISDAIIENQLRQAMKEAEDIAKAELEKESITIMTTVLETKPPVTTTTAVATTTETTTQTTIETTVATTETMEITTAETKPERVTKYKRGGLLDDAKARPIEQIKVRTLFTLTEDENKKVTNFLVEHYFLDGYVYAKSEADPEYKQKKQTAAEMQQYVSDSLTLVTNTIDMNNITSFLSTDYTKAIADAKELKSEYVSKYADANKLGDEFGDMYNSSIAYFDRLIKALNNFQKAADDYNNAANPILAIGLLAKSIDGVLMPEFTAVLESSFDIIEASQEIFLDGTTDAWLLTRDEVSEVIANPGLVL